MEIKMLEESVKQLEKKVYKKDLISVNIMITAIRTIPSVNIIGFLNLSKDNHCHLWE